ncbi:MAG: ImpA domain protein, partial [Candidatus Solibacter sp.]|nr:ImpA domain protein [Candidatus Solibacter sp.]
MPDLESMPERILDWDRLLQPIAGDNPSGRSMRYEPVYDTIRDGLKPTGPPPVGVAPRDQKLDYRAVMRDAGNLLARDSKDLDVAVWLTEALVGEYGFAALAEGILLIQNLLDAFWPTLYPNIDEDGDEGFRAKPISRLNQAFAPAVLQLQITADARSQVQYSLSQYNTSREVPTAAKASNSSEQQEKRDKALAEGAISPEDIDQAIEGTQLEFYRELAEDVKRAAAAVEQLQQSCNRLFKTDDKPYLEKFSNQLEGLGNTIESLGATKAPAPPPPPPPTASWQPPAQAPIVETYSAPAAAAPAPAFAAAPPAPEGIPSLAASLREQDSSDPVPYMLLRSWRFGPMIGRGAPAGEHYLQPPSTELRTALRRAVLDTDWWEV